MIGTGLKNLGQLGNGYEEAHLASLPATYVTKLVFISTLGKEFNGENETKL